MPGSSVETLILDILTRDRASEGLTRIGKSAAGASGDVSGLAGRLDEVGRKSVAARVGLDGNKEALAALDRLDAKLVTLDRKTANPAITVEGAARAAAEIAAVDIELDKLKAKSEEAAGSGGLGALAGGAGGGGGAMGALIAAGVVLSPVLVTVGLGLGGVAAAAAGVAMPIEKAAKAAGGLQANMAKLNPEQQKVAQGLLGLGQQFAGFEHQMQPAVFGIFNQGLVLAGHLLHDLEPVSMATGKALGGMLGQIDAEFASGTWQQFFGFMARTAGPDVQQLGSLFTSLMHALPPLLEALQPLGSTLLTIGTDAARAAGPIAGLLKTASDNAAGSAHNFNAGAKSVDNWTVAWTDRWIPGAKTVNRWLGNVQHAAEGSAAGLADSGHAALVAGPKFFSLNKEVAALSASMTKLVGNLLTLQGGELAWQQSLKAAETQLRSNSAGLAGNSRNALANKQAVLASTNAAITFAGQELATGKNIAGASDTVQRQIRWLQGLHDKSQFARDELHALRQEEKLLAAQQINQTIHVQGLGQWSVSQSLAPGTGHRRARGGLIPGAGGGDTYLALLTPGEVVVPAPMVKAGLVDHLRGSLPGFAAGGLVPSERGLAGMVPWVKTDDRATIRLIDQAVVKATLAGMKAAQAAAQAAAAASGFGHAGPGGGAPAANAALARRMFPGEDFAAWNYVAMRESGWNQFARNPSSGAYGIAQALPPTKYPFAGQAAGGSNPAAQISWMEGYMRSRYGGAAGAAAHEQAFNWYGGGGSEIFTHPTVIGVGERGPERVDITPLGRGHGGPAVQFGDVNIYGETDEALVRQKLSFAVMAAGLGS